MKQEISSTGTSSIHFQNDENVLHQLFKKGLVRVNPKISSQMWNTCTCELCQIITSNILNYLDLYNSNLICGDCGELIFHTCDCEELGAESNSTAMRIFLRWSSVHSSSAPKVQSSCCSTKEINEKIKILINNIKTVHNNIQHLNGELMKHKNSLQRLSQECSSLKMNFQKQNIFISQLKSDQDMTEQNLSVIRQKMEDFHYATYDGSLIWKITDFAKVFDDARSSRKTSIYSPLFFSSTSGYNMRARLDAYGDGNAWGTHMSVFLVIFKGEYDGILPWPFNYPVTFCLFDQIHQEHHIIDSFYPDVRSNSFQRPLSDKNIASGILKFCQLQIIEQQENYYIQEDTMFIRIRVDFSGTPRSLLPYASGLNPGLPTHIQEAMRLKQIEEYNQLRSILVAKINQDNQEISQRGLIPVQPRVRARNRQQPSTSTTDSPSISCEDSSDDE